MLFDGSGDLVDRLDDPTREKLIELFVARSEFFQAQAQIDSMRVEQFKGSSHVELSELESYVKEILEPRRTKMRRIQAEMLKDAVDLESIKSLLPAVVAGLMAKVDLELVFNIIGLDADDAAEGMELIREFITLPLFICFL